MHNKIKLAVFFLIVFSVSFSIKAQDETITNQEVIALTDAGLSKTIIIEKISDSKSAFNLSTTALIELKKAGVADEVITAMFKAKKGSSSSIVYPTSSPIPTLTTTRPATNPISTTTTQPTTTSTANSSSLTASTDSDDPVCSKATLDKPNTTPYIKNICFLANLAINREPLPGLESDRAATPLLNLFVSKVAEQSKLFTNDAEKAEAAKDFFLEADKKRTDKQIGSPPSSSGTTSLAVKGGAPSIIGWAVENGAAISSISGNTVTVRVNPFGLLRAVSGEGFLGKSFLANLSKPNEGDVKYQNFLRKFSTGFSFDTTRGTETPTFIVSRQQLSAFSVRYEFINQRTPQSKEAQKLFRDFVDNNSLIFKEQGSAIESLVDEDGNYKNLALRNWLEATNKEIQAVPNPVIQKEKVEEIKKILKPSDDKLEQILNLVSPVAQQNYKEAVRIVIEKRIALFPVDELLNDPVVKTAFEKFADLTLSYVEKRKAFTEEVNKGTVATFEYTNNREPIAPDTSNFRFIWENGRFFKNTDFTFNASLTMYNKKPTFADVKKIRDFQFALQTDTLFENFGDTILTFAGRYERLNGDTVDDLGVIKPNTKGDVAIGQIKFTIPIADFGIRLPLSVTFANRTDLIKESTVRANFGFTFDLDPLFARFKPF